MMNFTFYVIDDFYLLEAKKHANQRRMLLGFDSIVKVIKHGKTKDGLNIVSINFETSIDSDSFKLFSKLAYKVSYHDDSGHFTLNSLKCRNTERDDETISEILKIANDLYIKGQRKKIDWM